MTGFSTIIKTQLEAGMMIKLSSMIVEYLKLWKHCAEHYGDKFTEELALYLDTEISNSDFETAEMTVRMITEYLMPLKFKEKEGEK